MFITFCRLSAVIVCALAALPARAEQDAPIEVDAATPADAVVPADIGGGLTLIDGEGGMGRILALTDLSEEVRTKVQQLSERRTAALTRWDQVNDPNLKNAETRIQQMQDRLKNAKSKKKGKDDHNATLSKDQKEQMKQKITQGQRAVAVLKLQRLRLSYGYEMTAFALLTPKQRAVCNGPAIEQKLLNEFTVCVITPKQSQAIAQLARNQGARLNGPFDPSIHAKALTEAKKIVYSKVLTTAQRKNYVETKTRKTKKNKKDKDKNKDK